MPRNDRWSAPAVGLLLCALWAGSPRAQQSSPARPLGDKDWSLFERVFGLVLRDYVDPKTPAEVILGALKGAASSAGPECAYIPPEEVAAYRNLAKPGADLPLYVTKDTDFARILAFYPGADAPARPGDLLRFIGDRSTYDMTYPQVLEAMRGKADEKVRCIFIKPDSWQSTTAELTRRPPCPPTWTPLEGGGCLALPCLEAPAPPELAKSLRAARGTVVVDLRGCASGNVASALAWAGELLGKGEGPPRKGPSGIKRDPLAGAGFVAGRPLRVLVDDTTARGGEVLAAALVQAGGLLLGSPTFGWAPYPEDLPLENGGLLHLNTSYFLGPDGQPLKDHPMDPAVQIPKDKQAGAPAWAMKVAPPAAKEAPGKDGR